MMMMMMIWILQSALSIGANIPQRYNKAHISAATQNFLRNGSSVLKKKTFYSFWAFGCPSGE